MGEGCNLVEKGLGHREEGGGRGGCNLRFQIQMKEELGPVILIQYCSRENHRDKETERQNGYETAKKQGQRDRCIRN